MNKREAKIISDNVISVLAAEQEKRGISNYKISQACGLSESALSYIKNLKQNPQLQTLIMMSDAIGCPLSEIFKRVEEK